jgi:hypothetical protein
MALHLRYLPAEVAKNYKHLSTTNTDTEIWTRDLQNAKQEFCPLHAEILYRVAKYTLTYFGICGT